MNVIVTGGAGFIGSNLIHLLLAERPDWRVLNLDALTYAGNLENLTSAEKNPAYMFAHVDITDMDAVKKTFEEFAPDAVMHLAAESHVDRSILDAGAFIKTNVLGTQILLDTTRALSKPCRFLHVSTDEVYGTLGETGYFIEETPLSPNSPYSASKAGSDMLVRAAFETHGMDVITTRCSNNYGPYQFPEKLIPLMIANALEDKPLPVYGDGMNVRDWLYVEDHARALLTVLERGKAGEVYNIGGHNEKPNIEIVKRILAELNKPERLITYVKDRPGHDRRYAIDASKIERELGWTPEHTFEQALPLTVRWYLNNREWTERVRSGAYQEYYEKQYGDR
jgi:dTDP-glucose 4,6-dehydratase